MKYYITTAIDYTNGPPHIGHAYEKIIADAVARWHRLKGEDVFFLTGTDEHGQKVEKAAKNAEMTPKEFTDSISAKFKELLEKLNISNDKFIRTTDKNHIDVAEKVFDKIYKKGDIYKGTYEGLYCTGCEAFFTEREAVNGCCPIHKKQLDKVKEESYFFKIGNYQKQLVDFIGKNKNFILPATRRNEILNRLKEDLRDLSISRASFSWGIPLKIDKKHVIYVWFEALLNYLSGIDYPNAKFKKYWPADVHLIGKDIIWFHTVIWPCILFAAGIEPPKSVFAHGFVNIGGEKLSKSRGIAVDPINLIDAYGADTLRYFFLKEIVCGEDGDFSEEALVKMCNSALADDLGNLLMRTIVMANKYFDGAVPKQGKLEGIDEELIEKSDVIGKADKCIQNLEVNKAIEIVWEFIRHCNKYINETEPWKIKDKERLGTVLYNLIESLRIISILVSPFIPKTAENISKQLGFKLGSFKDAKFSGKTKGKVGKPEILIKKLELAEEDPIARFDFRVGKVLSVEDHPSADRLYVLKVKLDKERQLVAGLRSYIKKEDIAGKNVVVVANLKPAKLKGIESQGMLLAAEKNGKVVLLEAPKSKPGDRVFFKEGKLAAEVTIDEFSKLKITVKGKKVALGSLVLKTSSEEVKADIEDGATVK